MCFITSSFTHLIRYPLILVLSSCGFVWADDGSDPLTPITIATEQIHSGSCTNLVIAENDQTHSCGRALSILIMSNGSASITLEHDGEPFSVFGTALSEQNFTILGAVTSSSDNTALHGSCEKISMISGESDFVCSMADDRDSAWKIQFKIASE